MILILTGVEKTDIARMIVSLACARIQFYFQKALTSRARSLYNMYFGYLCRCSIYFLYVIKHVLGSFLFFKLAMKQFVASALFLNGEFKQGRGICARHHAQFKHTCFENIKKISNLTNQDGIFRSLCLLNNFSANTLNKFFK